MSADNWRACPVCLKQANERKAKREKKASNSYGKVSAEEYTRLLAAAVEPVALEETLREDYEIGTGIGGEFFVSYTCACNECGFRFRFKHSEQVPLTTPQGDLS